MQELWLSRAVLEKGAFKGRNAWHAMNSLYDTEAERQRATRRILRVSTF
jgi:hypothetical protein